MLAASDLFLQAIIAPLGAQDSLARLQVPDLELKFLVSPVEAHFPSALVTICSLELVVTSLVSHVQGSPLIAPGFAASIATSVDGVGHSEA